MYHENRPLIILLSTVVSIDNKTCMQHYYIGLTKSNRCNKTQRDPSTPLRVQEEKLGQQVGEGPQTTIGGLTNHKW